jgi:CheY-like chemotaxis protein
MTELLEEKNILSVDDERIVQKMMTKLLGKQGINVISATNGKEALEILQTKKIDLILLDVMMPVMDGFETLKRIKADEKLKNIPVIILTASANVRTFSRMIKMGADDFLVKPFEQSNLRRKIDFHLQDASRRNEEINKVLNSDKPLGPAPVQELKLSQKSFIQGFEYLYPKMLNYATTQNKQDLTTMLMGFQKKCAVLGLENAAILSRKIIDQLEGDCNWEEVTANLEAIYNSFQKMLN